MKLGISSYALTWAIGVPGYAAPVNPLRAIDLLKIAREHDVRLVQIADNIPLHELGDEALSALAARSRADRIELEIGTRGTEPDHLLAYLGIAKLLGASLVRTLITQPDLAEPTEQLLRVLPAFSEAGVRIAVENHGLHTTGQLASLFSTINDPSVGCCLDTVNSFSALDSPDRVMADLIPFITNLHIKDFDITRVDHQMGFMVLGKPAGYGKLDIPSLLARIRSHGKDPNAILELWTPYTNTMEDTILLERQWLAQSLNYLKTLSF